MFKNRLQSISEPLKILMLVIILLILMGLCIVIVARNTGTSAHPRPTVVVTRIPTIGVTKTTVAVQPTRVASPTAKPHLPKTGE